MCCSADDEECQKDGGNGHVSTNSRCAAERPCCRNVWLSMGDDLGLELLSKMSEICTVEGERVRSYLFGFLDLLLDLLR